MATRRYNFRLYPNKQQEQKLFLARRLHCYLYNACLAHRRYEWRKSQKSVDYFEHQNCLPEFKKEWVEFAELNSQTLQRQKLHNRIDGESKPRRLASG